MCNLACKFCEQDIIEVTIFISEETNGRPKRGHRKESIIYVKSIPLTWSERNSRSTKKVICSYLLEGEDRITGNEVIEGIDAVRIAIEFKRENVEQLYNWGPSFLNELMGIVAAPWSQRPYVVPKKRDCPYYKRRWMTRAANSYVCIGLQLPKNHLPSRSTILDTPFAPWSALRGLNPLGNHALAIIITSKDKSQWNAHHRAIDAISVLLELYALTYRCSLWEMAVNTSNPEIGRYIRDHWMMTYMRWGRRETFYYYDDKGRHIGLAPDGVRQYFGRRENARHSLMYERDFTCCFTEEQGIFDRSEYREKWPYLKTKIDRDSENLIADLFRLSRSLTEGSPDNPRQAHIALKKLHLNELPRRIRRKARVLRGKPVMFQIDWLLRSGVDKGTIYKCLENLPWPSETIWTTDMPNAPWTCLDHVLDRSYVDDVFARRKRPSLQALKFKSVRQVAEFFALRNKSSFPNI